MPLDVATVGKPNAGATNVLLYTMPPGREGYVNTIFFHADLAATAGLGRAILIVYADQSSGASFIEYVDNYIDTFAPSQDVLYVRGPVEDAAQVDPADPNHAWLIGALGDVKMEQGMTVSLNFTQVQPTDQLSQIAVSVEYEDVGAGLGPDLEPIFIPVNIQDPTLAVQLGVAAISDLF